MATEGLPLKKGHSGFAVVDLHQRLDRAGFGTSGSEEFDDATVDAVRRFQTSRRLDDDGIVGSQTWAALAEAAYDLGDRLLYHRTSPMLRGDDVAGLQKRLGALGFDAGRVDGIFGPDTARALEDFQRNAGLPGDAVFGPDSLAALLRLGGRDDQANVSLVRERERLRRGTDSEIAVRIVLGSLGGLGGVVDTIARRLRLSGFRVDEIDHPDESRHAALANQLDAHLYLGVIAETSARCQVSYFATDGFESIGGARLAQLATAAFGHRLPSVDTPVLHGQRRPVLRETRMPAVVIRMGPPEFVVEHGPAVGEALDAAVTEWIRASPDVAPESGATPTD